jgi:GDP-4-dehydro-6-deoxy-D-mannose reductase
MAKRSEAVLSETAQIGPSNPYGVSKVAQDLLALSYFYSYKLPILRARPFNHIGERQELGFAISDFAKQIIDVENGTIDAIKVGNLNATRDFTDVKDVVKAYQTIMEKGSVGEVYNIGSGQGTTLQFILDTLITLSGTDVTVEIDQAKLRPLDVESIIANVDKLQSLGWKTEIPLQETLQRVLNFWRSK